MRFFGLHDRHKPRPRSDEGRKVAIESDRLELARQLTEAQNEAHNLRLQLSEVQAGADALFALNQRQADIIEELRGDTAKKAAMKAATDGA